MYLLCDGDVQILVKNDDAYRLKKEVLTRLGEGIKDKAQSYLEANNTLYTGEISKEIKVKEIKKKITVRFDSDQAKWIEFGTGPARRAVPIEPLKEWAKVKLKMPEKQAKSFAIMLSQRITRYGIRAQPFIYPAIYSMKNYNKRL